MILTKKPILLVGFPRVGTQAFCELLFKTGYFYSLGEIFHDNYIGKTSNFFNFQREKLLPVMLSGDFRYRLNSQHAFELYLKFVCNECELPEPAENLILDVKYSSLNNIISDWSYFDEVPTIIDYFMKSNLPIFHLVRRNKLASVVSLCISQKTGKWINHDSSNQSVNHIYDVEINIDDANYFMRCLKASERFINDKIGNYENAITFENELVFDVNVGQAYIINSLKNLFQIKSFGKVVDVPILPTLKKSICIKNIDELISNFSGDFPDARELLNEYTI